MWQKAAPYVYQILVSLVAVVSLLKDWNDYGKLSKKYGKAVPLTLAGLIVLITAMSLQSIYSSRVETKAVENAGRERDIKQQTRIDELNNQVGLGRQENQKNSEGFRQSFASLYDKFSDLQSKVRNQELLAQLQETKHQLLATQKKLNAPKARLDAYFYTTPYLPIPHLKETTIEPAQGAVQVDVVFENVSETDAASGHLRLTICEDCKWVNIPSGFSKVDGDAEQTRVLHFDHLNPQSISNRMTFSFIPPFSVRRIQLGASYSCATCVVEPKQSLWVNLTRK